MKMAAGRVRALPQKPRVTPKYILGFSTVGAPLNESPKPQPTNILEHHAVSVKDSLNKPMIKEDQETAKSRKMFLLQKKQMSSASYAKAFLANRKEWMRPAHTGSAPLIGPDLSLIHI